MKKIIKGVVFGLACNCLFSGVASGMEKIKFEGLDTNCYAVCDALREASPEEVQRVLRELPENYFEYRAFRSPEEFWAILSTGNYGLVVLACGDDIKGALSDAAYCLGDLYEFAKKTGNKKLIEFIRNYAPKDELGEEYKLRRDQFGWDNITRVKKTISEVEKRNLELVRKLMLEGKRI